MIKTFHNKSTAAVFQGQFTKTLPRDIQPRAFAKLRLLHSAATLDDLKVPPGNRLEPLKGNRAGQWSLRINNQFRICFVWKKGDAYDVEITDYH